MIRKRKYLCPVCKSKIDSHQLHFVYSPRQYKACPFCMSEVVKFEGKTARKIIKKMGVQ